MANQVKTDGESGVLLLQITSAARKADLVDESTKMDGEKEVTVVDRMAPIRTYAFEGFVLVVDRERVDDEDIVDMVTSVAENSGTIYQSAKVKVQRGGNGFQVPINVAKDAGWRERHKIEFYPAQGVLGLAWVSSGEMDVPREKEKQAAKLGELVQTVRDTQLKNN